MNGVNGSRPWSSEEAVVEELQRRQQVLMRLAENAFTVAESLRDNYFKNTAAFISALRRSLEVSARDGRPNTNLSVCRVQDAAWPLVQGEVVTFIDGGVGQAQIASQVPILLRVGSYSVRTGERRLAEREQFGYYPIILGDLEGGSKERKDFVDIVRITAELLGSLAALERIPDLRVLMLHGPLVYLVGSYAGHAPFTEADIDRFLHHYAPIPEIGRSLKDEFLAEARLDVYPALFGGRAEECVHRRLFEPLSWIAFLYRRLIRLARSRTPAPIIAGVVERGSSDEFSRTVLLERIFHGLRRKHNIDYFNNMYGRTDLTTPKTLLDRLGYTDPLLLSMLLAPGDYSEPWQVAKYDSLHHGNVTLPGESFATPADFSALRPGPFGFPSINGFYLCISETTEPIRVEVFSELGDEQVAEAARRVYLYASMLPGYGFPVGLDIADKFAKVPAWLSNAYSKLIRFQLGVSLQQGDISDAEMRRLLVQAIYMTHRDWLFRPTA
ncbi:MAG: DNA double-strand break repair nuclease NurA [Chloroflexi bacterium]|nr:DNA double-strand break repair nuclease NurA [Chloroflexota bacterium]